jgi:hypothetical protein
MTDFWQPFFENYSRLKEESDRATGEYAYAVEVRRGKGIVDAVATVMDYNENGEWNGKGVLERLIWSTLPSFKEVSGGKYTFVYHFDSKAVVTGYLKEKDGGTLWERSSLLNMGFYMDNLVRYGGLMGAAKVCFLLSLCLSYFEGDELIRIGHRGRKIHSSKTGKE